MSDWRGWNLQTWNGRLLSHFFRCHEELAPPVVVLLTTPEELARATGEPVAKAEAVRDAFVERVRLEIGHRGGLLEDAADYEGWPNPPRISQPRFVAHLLFTCIAASESSDELADERSFISRLRILTRDQLPEHSLQWLPRLWQNLRDWLAANEGEYRPLLLPDPGGYARIGYTVKLAFPDRRDQLKLSELLDRAGLSGYEPPVRKVLSLVAAERASFNRSFQIAFDEFRQQYQASAEHRMPELVEHRFWAAVREATLRGRGQSPLVNESVRLSLLGEEEEDRLALLAVADEQPPNADVGFAELPIAHGPWRFALVPEGADTADVQQVDRTTRAILDGSLRLPSLSSHVDQGLLPFVIRTHGLLELAHQDELGDVTVALVRKSMVNDLRRVACALEGTVRSSLYDGWVQVHGLKLRVMPSEHLDRTALNRTWILHESLSPPSIRLRGGVRLDDGWLGVQEVLPIVIAPGASSIVCDDGATRLPLDKSGPDTWSLPPHDLTGQFTLVASFGNQEGRRRVRFHAMPLTDRFKPPTDSDAWIVEEVGGTGTLSSSMPLTSTIGDQDCAPFCDRVLLLGPDVGTFVAKPEEAAWRIMRFGGKSIGARAGLRGDAAIPSSWVASAKARRRWRRILLDSAGWSDPEFEEARRRVMARVINDAHLPRLSAPRSIPELRGVSLASPSASVDRLVGIIAGRAALRAGIPWRDWSELAQRVLDIDAAMLERVTRAWMEAGLIDVASFARWWHRALFVKSPRLVAFKVGELVCATLSGLALTAVKGELQRAAERAGVLVEERFSVSPFVPQTISICAPDRRVLEMLAATCRLDLSWLDLNRLQFRSSSRHDGTSAPPDHYERSNRWPEWSLKAGEYPGVTVEHRMRRDRPDYWLTSSAGGQSWSYDLNVTRAWAAALIGECPVTYVADDTFIEANHAFVPLPIARAISLLGPGLPGPTDAREYRYPVGKSRLRDLVLTIISRTFDPSRLATLTNAQSTG